MKNLLFILIAIVSFFSCKKNEYPKPEPMDSLPADSSGTLTIKIKNVVGSSNLVLGNTKYVNGNNDTFSVSIYKYYISNIKLSTTTNYTYTESDSYYLVDQSKSGSLNLLVKKVPKESYSSISFYVGVDSTHNVSGAQTGFLDPIFNMFWDWNQGYIMAKLEGFSPQSTDPSKRILYHIGGYSGPLTGVKKVTLNFPNLANVSASHTPTLNINADVDKWFTGTTPIYFSVSPSVGDVSVESSNIANNYATMFSVTSVVN